jgi:hypothetical protein
MTSFAPREAMTTAAAAGAVTIICNQHLVSSLNPFGNCRPGGEAFFEFFVYFVDCFVVKNSC